MNDSSKRIGIFASIGIATLVVVVVVVLIYFNRPRMSADTGVRTMKAMNLGTGDIRDVHELRVAWDEMSFEFQQKLSSAAPTEQAQLWEAQAKKTDEMVDRCLLFASETSDPASELSALFLVASRAAPDSHKGRGAKDSLLAKLKDADLEQLLMAMENAPGGLNIPGIGAALLSHVQQNPTDPRFAEVLTKVCLNSRGAPDDDQPAKEFTIAADLITLHHAASADITNFCESLGSIGGSPPWARQYEKHLRTILEKNQDRQVRCAALFALASVVDSVGDRKTESHQLYSRFVTEFDGQHAYPYQQIELMLNEQAKTHLQ